MPIKLDRTKPTCLIFYNRTSLIKKEIPLVKPENYHADNILKNCHFNKWHNFVFRMVDLINPIVYKHPKLNTKLMNFAEKLLKNSNELNNNI